MSRISNSQTNTAEAKASLADVFSEGPFRFRLGTRPGDAASFFAPSEPHDEILAERRHWLMTDPARYAVLLPEGEAALDATLGQFGELSKNGNLSATPFEKLLTLGCSWEPDFVLLRRDSSDRMVVVGGCVCFPTFWRLTDKLGQPVGIVHDVVPGLNATIGPGIDNFLSRMKPGCWERSNWGMCLKSQVAISIRMFMRAASQPTAQSTTFGCGSKIRRSCRSPELPAWYSAFACGTSRFARYCNAKPRRSVC